MTGQVKVPQRAELKQGNPGQMAAAHRAVARSPAPRPPPPAQALVDQLGVQLDALGLQLKGLGDNEPAMAEVANWSANTSPRRSTTTARSPRTCARGICWQDRRRALGREPHQDFGEVDRVTRRLAEGALDDLAIKSRLS